MVITLTSPLLIGIYEDNRLVKSFQTEEPTSEALPLIFEKILEDYLPQRLFFARGPGSFMAIKISYIFLRTVSIAYKIPLLATDGFAFNDNAPIRAMRNLYFIKNGDEITTKRFEESVESVFRLPATLNVNIFSTKNEPLYLLPAV